VRSPSARPVRKLGALDVSDTGLGIAPEYLDKVFRFVLAGRYQHARASLVMAWVSAVNLWRPVGRAPGGDGAGGRSEGIDKGVPLPSGCRCIWRRMKPRLVQSQPSTARLHDLRVAPGDDSLDVLESHTMLLETRGGVGQRGFFERRRVAAAEDQSNTFDLIISDIGMPKMDGHQLIRRCARYPSCAGLPRLALDRLRW